MRPKRKVDNTYPHVPRLRVLTALKREPSWPVTWAQGGLFSSHTCFGHVVAERVSLRRLRAEGRSPSRANPSEFYGGKDSTRTSFSSVL